MLRGLFHDKPAHRGAAGKEDKLKRLIQKRQVFRPAARHDGHILRREAGLYHAFEHLGGMRGIGAGLDDGAVARGQRADERL